MAIYNALSTGGLLNGSNQQDTMNGSAVADQLNGLDGNDTLYGNGGNDKLYGGAGNDTLSGGEGDDLLEGGSGKDDMDGGAGVDTVSYANSTSGVAVLFSATDGNGVGQQYTNKSAGGYSGDANGDTYQNVEIFVGTQYADVISGGTSQMTFYLGAGNDLFDTNVGISAVDVVYGEAGNDTIWGGPSNDVLNGGDGNDSIFGEADNDTLIGGAGADALDGGAGTDTADYSTLAVGVTVNLVTGTASDGDTLVSIENVTGSSFNDVLVSAAGANVLNGGAGVDTVDYSAAAAGLTINLAAGNASDGDTLVAIENVVGTAFNDLISSAAGANTLNGGAGIDTVTYANSNSGVTVNLQNGVGTGGAAEGDFLINVENLIGSSFDDLLMGSVADNRLEGGAGNDVLMGGTGADVLDGGTGTDTVSYALSGAGAALSFSATDQGGIWGRFVNTAAGGYVNDAQGDVFQNVEAFVGSRYGDWIGGSSTQSMTYSLGDGADFFDTVASANVADEVYGGTGGDRIAAGGGDDLVYGDADDDYLLGEDGADKLYGGDGNDRLAGGAGADTLDGGAGVDTAEYSSAASGLTINLAAGTASDGDTLTSIENVVGSAFDDVLTGGDGTNVLEGGAGNDVLTGGSGDDKLYGGEGNDLFLVEWSNTGDQYFGGAGIDTFSANVAGLDGYVQEIDLATGTNNWQDRFDSIENLIGGTANDKFWGTDGANVFNGGNGNDLLDGRGGNDELYGDAGNDTLIGGAGADKLDGGADVDTADYSGSTTGLTINLAAGTASDGDTLVSIENVVGSAFNDTLISAAGANVLNGGAGFDTADYSAATAAVTVNLSAGTASDGDTLVSIENATGSAFNDTLISAAGANVLNGGDGVDTVDYSLATEGVTVNLFSGPASGSDGDTLISIENVVGSAFNDLLVASNAINVLNGGAGFDTVDYTGSSIGLTIDLAAGTVSDGDTLLSIENATGSSFNDLFISAAGANVLNGGAGVDTVDYSGSNAAVTVNLESGNGLGGTAEGDSLVSIENVIGTQWADVLTGNADANKLEGLGGDDTLHGLAGNDQVFGGEGNDRIYGGEGADFIDGGAGTDTADYRYSTAGVTVSLVTNTGVGGDAQGDELAGIENLAGSEFDDVLTGNDGVNRIVGGMGADQMYGMGGNDMFDTGGGYDFVDGGAGIDTVTYDDSWGAVVVNLATGTGSGAEAANDVYLNIESVTGSLFGDKLTGNAGVNQLTGLDGNDILDGGAGNDYLVGGLGADTLIGGAGDQDVADYDDAISGVIVNLVTGGTGGEAQGDTFSGVEYVYGSDFDDQITGNDSVNRLLGNDGNDLLDGGAGNDVLIGGAGADTLIGGLGDQDAASYQDAQLAVIVNLALGGTGGDAAGDTYNGIEYVYGSAFNDVIIGDNAINRLTGGAGNDNLDGAGGNDYLLGDAGNDVLTGGAGADVFVFNAGFGNDTITEFWAGLGRTDRAWFQGVTGISNYADVLSHAQDTAAGVLITVAGQGSLTLSGLTIAQLNADDFLFG